MNHFLLALLWVGGSVVLGQTKTPADSTKTNKALTTSDAFLPKITPKSPTSAAMARFGDIPVSLYTGQPTIEIPLFEFTVDALRVPIKLMYHPNGLKVADQASWVGMGWSLQTGGMVSRQILGLPDEKSGVATPFPSPGPVITRNLEDLASPSVSGGCIVDANLRAIYDAMAENKLDSQRDVFTYQLPSGTNSFMLGPTPSGEINPALRF